MLLDREDHAHALAPVWLFHVLAGRNSIVTGTIGKDSIFLKNLSSGIAFNEPPVLAVEEIHGRKLVKAVGRDVGGVEGLPCVSIHRPFESAEPLFAEYDVAVALIQHALREVFKARWALSPKVVLQLANRQTQLSDGEKKMLQSLAKDCGIARLYVFLAGQCIPDVNEMRHAELL